jgi:hypothetical protein
MVSVVYFDTSALLKYYVAEIGSSWVNALLSSSPAPVVFISQLTIVESSCAFARRLREGVLSPTIYADLLTAFDYDLNYKYTVVDVMPVIIDTARQLAGRHPLRAYDALQLATSWLINKELLRVNKPPLTFFSADDRLITIAQAEGLLTNNPNHHP